MVQPLDDDRAYVTIAGYGIHEPSRTGEIILPEILQRSVFLVVVFRDQLLRHLNPAEGICRDPIESPDQQFSQPMISGILGGLKGQEGLPHLFICKNRSDISSKSQVFTH